ncbi:glycerate kinase family protein [Oceanospirillum linum]|uniref:Glycerate kinase n=1 Tax=Oceanospirillum linum TaxID=966 RepID=A0A1T1HCC1_OCELI|nr:glycerate kinase [Oceanospirillum linum]OOV87475.1 hypothetical protein BTA35_0205375 [Oceanospirillum linum]SEF89141.1 glycerate kinase [Oleiphilus messinensis]SMP13647.1 glycerate kinase [Oceanospirillum linum]
MKFLIAPDSFKESMTAGEACCSIAQAIKHCLPDADITALPLADGGEGTLDVLISALDGQSELFTVTGPLFHPVQAKAGIVKGDTAIIEIAEAAGLHLVPSDRRNPDKTTTLGVGQLILAMLDKGIRRFLIALGGSATNDGGIGMLMALGAQPLSPEGQEVLPTGEMLNQVSSLSLDQLDPRLGESEFLLACDVSNPLTGEKGASTVFGPQKGATVDQVLSLDHGLINWSEVLYKTFGRSVADIPGSGAAGGLAAAFLAAFNTSLKPGIEQVLDIVAFDRYCAEADWVITGEGCLDGQSLAGKTPVGVARRAQRLATPVVALTGKLGDGYEAVYKEGISLALSITPENQSLEQALGLAQQNLFNATQVLLQLLFSEDSEPLK